MDNFNYSIYIPSLKRKSRFKQLNNKDYKTIVKFIENNDDLYLETYFKNLICSLSVDKIDIDRLTNQDIICILLGIRNVCIGSTLELIYEHPENGNVTVRLSVGEILHKITNIDCTLQDIEVDNISVKSELPNKLCNVEIYDFISHVSINKKSYNIKDVATGMKDSIIDLLPVQVVTSLRDQLNQIQEVVLFRVDNKPVSVFKLCNKSGFDLLKLVYSASLQGIYNKYYFLASKLNFDLYYIDNSTPIDIDIYLNQYAEEQEAIKSSQESKKGVDMTKAPVEASSPETAIPGGFKF